MIAATIPIQYGNKTWYLYGASDNAYRNAMPNYLLQWEMIRWAIESGCEIYDFRGVSGRAFDGRGNYNLGVREQIIFPEIEYDKVDRVRGLNISITTTAKTDEECKALLSAYKFPFRT